jgi:hypothetical protein
VERFEAWLRDQGIEITGQFSTGSGDMVRFQLRLLDGAELDVALSATTLAERPEQAITMVQEMIDEREHGQQRGNGRS